jgi:adenosylcobinamide-GDP ribazoletransferase
MIFLVMMEFGFMTSAYAEGLIYPAALVMIMAVPRGLSALMMMSLEPMETSQYIEMQKDDKARGFLIIQLILWVALAFAFSGGDRMRVLITVLACGIGTLASIFIARKELQGMNGDVAGYGILWGELLGMMSLIITL